MKGNPIVGAGYLAKGFRHLNDSGLRRFVILPLLFNMIFMGLLSWWGIGLLSGWIEALSAWLPSWLHWLYWVVMPMAALALVVILAYFFSTLLMVLMAPLSGLLSEQVDKQLGNELPSESIWTLTKRTLWRELVKLGYLLPRYLLLFIISFLPVLNLVAPALWILFTSWVLAIQYGDYVFDNRQLSFRQARQAFASQLFTMLGFGAAVMLLLTIPLINWFVIPAAVIGVTYLCHEQNIKNQLS